MPGFSGLPLVIEPRDLLARLDAPELILIDLTSVARYEAGQAGRSVQSLTASQRSQACEASRAKKEIGRAHV